MSLPKLDMDEVREYIKNTGENSIIYLGADSERVKLDGVWYADYFLVIVVHIDGCHGGKIFGEIQRERDFDSRKDRPSTRLMNETYKVAQLFLDMEDILHDRLVEIHLDLNPDEMHGSSCVVNQAVGYIKGVTNTTPRIKPNAFAASYAADRLKFVISKQKELKARELLP
jgi:predicted RNase H-related nuclease YkuK (DUF458 family)